MKSVFQFSSCREFLRAALVSAQESSPKLSLEVFADRLGVGRSSLKMILSGRRRLTVKNVHRVARALKLSAAETEYLQAMALKESTQNPNEKAFHNKRTEGLKKVAKLSSFHLNAKGLLADPYTLPVLVFLTDFRRSEQPLREEEMVKIAKRFGLEVARVKKIIEVLIDLGAIQKSEGEIHYVFDRLTHLINQQQYLKSWLMESAQRIDTEYKNSKSLFHVSTISLDAHRVPELARDLKAVLEKYIGMPAATEQQVLLQTGIQILSLLREP